MIGGEKDEMRHGGIGGEGGEGGEGGGEGLEEADVEGKQGAQRKEHISHFSFLFFMQQEGVLLSSSDTICIYKALCVSVCLCYISKS